MQPANIPPTINAWDEDLKWQARRGYEVGRESCTCEGSYHVLWGALRASGFLGSLSSEEPALAATLLPLVRSGTKILIGGSADPGTLCAVGRAVGESQPDITVIDRCAAPLRLISEFCEKRFVPCRFLHANLLDLTKFGKWDVIILNYTTAFIDRGNRRRFFTQIKAALNPGGSLVCLAKTGTPVEKDDISKLQSGWQVNASHRLRDSDLGIAWKAGEVDALVAAAAAARTARRSNIMGAGEVRAAIEAAGLTIVRANLTERKWAFSHDSKADVEGSLLVQARNDFGADSR